MKILFVILVGLAANVSFSSECNEQEKKVMKEVLLSYETSSFLNTCSRTGSITTAERNIFFELTEKSLTVTRDEGYDCRIENIGDIYVSPREIAEVDLMEFDKMSNKEICENVLL